MSIVLEWRGEGKRRDEDLLSAAVHLLHDGRGGEVEIERRRKKKDSSLSSFKVH